MGDPFGFHHLLSLLVAGLQPGRVLLANDEAERVDRPEDGLEADEAIGITRVGAWAGLSSMASPVAIKRDVGFARWLGLSRLDVIVNDDSGERDPIPYRTYTRSNVEALCNAAREAGLAVHLMTWIMPHREYIEGAAEVLTRLAEDVGAESIVFDAEEPWTLARKRLHWTEAAALIEDAFAGKRLGVTGIGYAAAEKLGPLARVCDYLVPQCYATASNADDGIEPGTVVARFANRWRRVFGADRPIVAGLAGYRQVGIPGHTPATALRAAFNGAESDPEIREAVYWSLGQIRANAAVARTIRELAARR